MKILVSSSSPPDRGQGISAYAKELSEVLVGLGAEVHYLSPTPNDKTWLGQNGIRHIGTNQHNDPFEAARRTLRYIFDNGIEGAINNDNPVLQSIAPALTCPLVVVGHLNYRSLATLACYNQEWVDHIVTISSDMQRAYVNRYNVPLIKAPIIFNGVRDRGHDGDFSQKSQGVLHVVYAGGLTHRKGGKLLLKALMANAEKWKGVRLDWFGAVPDHVARRIAHIPEVILHGQVPREVFLNTLRDADVLLLPSRQEGCPMVMLEAMSYGVVPIASDGVGAMRWLITSGHEGFICYLNRWPAQMLECITYLRNHPERLMEMKRASRARYLKEFQSVTTAENLLRLLQRPAVDRSRPLNRFTVLRWHRPLRPDGIKSPLIDRFCIRFGLLRKAGILTLEDQNIDK